METCHDFCIPGFDEVLLLDESSSTSPGSKERPHSIPPRTPTLLRKQGKFCGPLSLEKDKNINYPLNGNLKKKNCNSFKSKDIHPRTTPTIASRTYITRRNNHRHQVRLTFLITETITRPVTIEPEVMALFMNCAELLVSPDGIDWTHHVWPSDVQLSSPCDL